MTKTILVAETGADIPVDVAEQYGIRIVPMHVSFGDEALPDGTFPVDKVNEYYLSTRSLPKTSGSMPGDFTNVFDEIHEEYPEANIVHLANSAITTCSYQSAVIAAEGRDYVTSIDTKNVSGGQGAIAIRLAQLLEKRPNLPLEAVKAAAHDLIERIRMCFLPGDLAYLKAGGRISNAQYLGAQILGLHPLIEIDDGKLISTKKYRGSVARIAARLISEYSKAKNLAKDSICFLHSAQLDDSFVTKIEDKPERKAFNRSVGYTQDASSPRTPDPVRLASWASRSDREFKY